MPPRRTQKERREGTIGRLLGAATETLIEVGYAEASVQRICARAGVSQGALFRHFATREALMVAVGRDVGQRVLAAYRRAFEARGTKGARLGAALKLVRRSVRSRLNRAWYELSIAARTSPSLRRGLRPVARAYHADIGRLAAQLLPELAEALGEGFGLLVDTIVCVFDGEAMHRFVLPGRFERERLELFARLPRALGAGRGGKRSRNAP